MQGQHTPKTSHAPKLAVIGIGHLGLFHLQKLHQLQQEGAVTLLGGVEPNPQRRDELASQSFIIVPTQEHLKAQPDAVIIAAPTPNHAELCTHWLSQGVHVLVEKPLCTASVQARQLMQHAQQHQKCLWVGHVEQYNPAVQAALPRIDEPKYLVAERLGPFTGRSADVDIVLDLMIHDIVFLASLRPGRLQWVDASGVAVLTKATDMASVRLRFDTGFVAQLSAGRVSLESSRKIRVFSKRSYLSIDCQKRTLKEVCIEHNEHGETLGANTVQIPTQDALYQQDKAFIDAICAPKPSFDQAAVQALEWTELIQESIQQQKPIQP